jgi:putative intracellular protease/amidase
MVSWNEKKRTTLMRTILPFTLLLFCSLICGHAYALDTAKVKVGILLFDEVQIIDFAAPYEVFGQAGFEVLTVSASGKALTTAMGLRVSPDHSFTTLPKVDVILVPGGNVDAVMNDQQVQNWLKSQHAQVKHMLSVCTGAQILAESGLLNGLQATTFHRQLDDLAFDYPKISVLTDQRYVDNGKIITSAGLSSGMDAALFLVSKINGLEAAKTVAMHIEYDWQQDNGFVRGTMADQYGPDNHYEWPENTIFSNKVSYGDQDAWWRSYEVSSAASTDALLAVYRRAMLANPDWLATAPDQQSGLTWQKSIDGNTWQLAFAVMQNDAGDVHKITINLAKLQVADSMGDNGK